jgi:hypothetical protein
VGKPEETVVYARITATTASGATVVRSGSGFVIRCDGFVLIPEMLAPKGDTAFHAMLSFASVVPRA